MGLRVFDSSDPENLRVLRSHIVPLLVAESGITEWTVKLLSSAVAQVREVISRAAREHVMGQGTKTVLHPHELPIASEYALPLGKDILGLLSAESRGEEFQRHQHYGPWAKGLFNAAAFDSYSAEYRIAAMLNRSGGIRSVSYTHLRAHETVLDLVCRLLLEKKKQTKNTLVEYLYNNNMNHNTLHHIIPSPLSNSTFMQ